MNISIAIKKTPFLSAAQPTDQGTESVVLVVVVGTHFMSTEVQFFGVCKVANFL